MVTYSGDSSVRVSPDDKNTGRFFALYSLVGATEGVLSVYIRLNHSKHYELYERKAFKTAAAAGRFLQALEASARMYVIDSYFK